MSRACCDVIVLYCVRLHSGAGWWRILRHNQAVAPSILMIWRSHIRWYEITLRSNPYRNLLWGIVSCWSASCLRVETDTYNLRRTSNIVRWVCLSFSCEFCLVHTCVWVVSCMCIHVMWMCMYVRICAYMMCGAFTCITTSTYYPDHRWEPTQSIGIGLVPLILI